MALDHVDPPIITEPGAVATGCERYQSPTSAPSKAEYCIPSYRPGVR
jgi:hypothetical protein